MPKCEGNGQVFSAKAAAGVEQTADPGPHIAETPSPKGDSFCSSWDTPCESMHDGAPNTLPRGGAMSTKIRVGGRNCPLVKCQSQQPRELQLKLSRPFLSRMYK
jgi:hypothetical protein